jgi:PAS domain S-box-containing protein
LSGFQSKALTKKGKLIDIEISSTAQYNDNRELVAIHSIYRDITERKRSEEALKKSEKRYRDLVELAQDGIWQIDEKGFTTFVNKRMAEMLDYSVQEMMGKSFYHFVGEKEKQTYQEQINQSLNQVKVRFDVEFIKRDGSSIFTMVSTSSIFDVENTRQEILMVVTDITYRIISERKLRDAFEKVKRADSLKTVFLANMSHEIRTSLNNILGFVDLALLDNLPVQTLEKMSNIKNSGKQLLSIINDILDLAKIEAGQIQLEMLSTTMESIFYNFRSIAEVIVYHYMNKQLEIREHFPSHLNREIITDDIKLNQIFKRLLNNAAKFTQDGFIEYGVELNKSNQLQFYVKDSGVGIPKEKQQAIFNAFEQADSSITKPYSGTGLGLTISKKIVELMGGSIWVESEPSKGSTFYFTIPYLPTAIKQPQRMENPLSISSNRVNKTILIVEDIYLNQRLMKGLLEKTGYSVLLAKDGNESISIYKSNTLIDLIIMDLKLPQMNGYEAMQIIRQIEKEENRKSVPIIALSAYSLLEEIQSGVSPGFDNYLMKPVESDVLYKIIKDYLQC